MINRSKLEGAELDEEYTRQKEWYVFIEKDTLLGEPLELYKSGNLVELARKYILPLDLDNAKKASSSNSAPQDENQERVVLGQRPGGN